MTNLKQALLAATGAAYPASAGVYYMTTKKPRYVIGPTGNYSRATERDLDTAMVAVKSWLEGGADGSSFLVTIKYMTDYEYEQLPEWEGP